MELKPGYKRTEVGVIPEDWEVRTIGTIALVTSGGTPSRRVAEYWDGEIPWVTTTEINADTIREAAQSITDLGLANSAAKLLAPGALLLALYGQGKTRGKVALLGVHAATNQACAAIVVSSLACRKFVFHFLVSQYQNIRALSNSGSQENLSGGIVKSIAIPLPPTKAEQEAISEALSDADALIESLDQLIAKKRDLKQGAMQKLLTGKKRLPGFSGVWEVRPLGDVASFFKGRGLPKSELSSSGADRCIHYGELFTLYPETIGEIISRTDGLRDSFRSVANDVLMPTSDVTPRGLAKASCITADGVILGGDILVIRSNVTRLFGPFLSYSIRHEAEQVLQFVTGSTVFHLYGSDMKKFLFPIPPIQEQIAIATILSDMDAELDELQSRLAKAHQIKQGMMQELLTGRIRLL